MSVEKLFSTSKYDRREYFNENKDEWTREDLLAIVERANLDEDLTVINLIAQHPKSSEDDLKHYALSGKFGQGVIKSVLMNRNCSEEIIRGLYDKSADDKIFDYNRENDDKQWGEGSFEQYVISYIEGINELARKHKNFPVDLKN